MAGKRQYAGAWNFGPENVGATTVLEVINIMQKFIPNLQYNFDKKDDGPHEAKLLKLDCAKAKERLDWKNVLDLNETIKMTAEWYYGFYERNEALSRHQIESYMQVLSG